MNSPRNSPCPCGSGRKSKKCCALRRHEESRIAHAAWLEQRKAEFERDRLERLASSPIRRERNALTTLVSIVGMLNV